MEKDKFNQFVKRLWNANHTDGITAILLEFEKEVKSEPSIVSSEVQQEVKLEVGMVLIAKDVCKLPNGIEALIMRKEYVIKKIECRNIVIESEFDQQHYFHIDNDNPDAYFGNYFVVKQ